MRRVVTALGALSMVMAACGGGSGSDSADGSGDGTTSTGSGEPTTTSPDPSSTEDPSSTTTEVGLGPTERCENPEGFAIDYPADWSTNDGSVVPECSMFDPEPFEVPEGTDARVAAISAWVDAVPFAEVAAPDSDSAERQQRAVTVVDGYQALRVSGEEDGEGLYPEGTPFTRYIIDLSIGVDDGPGTLFIDVVGGAEVDHDQIQPTLDRMVRTMDISVGDEPDPSTAARYEGGGSPFAVIAEPGEGDEICFRLDGSSEGPCAAVEAAPALVRMGGDLQPILAGTAPADVFRVEAVQAEGPTISFLPVSVPDGAGARAFAFAFGRDDLSEIRWYDIEGAELGSASLESGEGDGGADPIAELGDREVTANGFPASGQPAFLTDIRTGNQGSFDRVVFDLTGDAVVSYRVRAVEESRAPSGQAVDVAGEQIIEVSIVPASRVDLSGDEPDVIYDGPQRIEPATTDVVSEIALVEDFESHLVWALGVPDGTRFAVDMLDDPQRVVVDVTGP